MARAQPHSGYNLFLADRNRETIQKTTQRGEPYRRSPVRIKQESGAGPQEEARRKRSGTGLAPRPRCNR